MESGEGFHDCIVEFPPESVHLSPGWCRIQRKGPVGQQQDTDSLGKIYPEGGTCIAEMAH